MIGLIKLIFSSALILYLGSVFSYNLSASIDSYRKHKNYMEINSNSMSADVVWGNQFFFDMAINDEIDFLGKTVVLHSTIGPSCVVSVDGQMDTLVTATRHLPQVINDVRIFVAWNKAYDNTSSNTYAPGTGENLFGECTKDAYICLSDPQLPLLDPDNYTFPIDRSDGFTWTMSERTHNLAWVSNTRIHEGIDIDMQPFRGKKESALLAIENSICVDKFEDFRNGWLLMQSISNPEIYYSYRHIRGKSNEMPSSITVSIGDTVSMGDKLGYIHGDHSWGHLHWTVLTRKNDFKHRFNWMINSMPAMYELWYGTCENQTPPFTSGDWSLYNVEYWKTADYFSGLYRYSDMAGHGWTMGDWNPTMCVESDCTSVILKKTVNGFTNPIDYYTYEIKVANGVYRVAALIGAQFPTGQEIYFEGVLLGKFTLEAGQFEEVKSDSVNIKDGKLTIRIRQIQSKPSGISRIKFEKLYY